MLTKIDQSNLRLQAETKTVEELINQVKRGLVRIPSFQRPLRWKAEDVKLLFDSIYQGYPIGSFLMRRAKANAATINYGPVQISAPDLDSALWVIDGQQRLTALTAGLGRDEKNIPKTPDDNWVIFFDAQDRSFHIPPRNGYIPSTWIPVPQLLDASILSEWVFNWEHGADSSLRKSVFEAGTRIRQYEIPLYIVETDEDELLRDIFYRINDSGKKLKWEEIHDALFGRQIEKPSTLDELSDELSTLGMGRPPENQLLSAIIAYKGLDVTRSISEHYRRDPEVLKNAVKDTLPALTASLNFLKTYAMIPHLRLLPRSIPLVVITKFFGRFPEPNERTLNLLVRWTWRTLFSIKLVDERTLLRHSLNKIGEHDQEKTVQELLKVIPKERDSDYVLPRRFDARAADSRIFLVALNFRKPLDLETENLIDVANLVEKHDLNAFRKIVSRGDETTHSPANRILLPPYYDINLEKKLVDLFSRGLVTQAVLNSHCVSIEAIKLLKEGKKNQFLELRNEEIIKTVNELEIRLAAWDSNDRPSIRYILEESKGSE